MLTVLFRWFRCVSMIQVVAVLALFIHPTKARAASAQTRSDSLQLSPQALFKRVSPSVFVVEALDSEGSVIAFGSGVAVQGPTWLTTNWHVIEEAASTRVRRGDKTWPATISRCNAELDLCQLYVPSLNAPLVPSRLSSTLQVGERVYAIGAPEGLELTFSEGIISGLRASHGQSRMIQTTAPVSQWF